MTERGTLTGRARQLRAELDERFARPRELTRPPTVALLAIRIGEEPFALRLTETEGVLADRPITRLPSPVPELIGLCAIRGAIAPVYDLAALLGRAVTRRQPPRWLVLTKNHERLALAFDVLDGQIVVPATEIAATAGDAAHDGTVLVHDVLRPLIRIASVLDAIERRVGPLQEPSSHG
jgi:chemotaxis signal transduction protein